MTDTIIQISEKDTIVISEDAIEVISVGIQGPPGNTFGHTHTISDITGLQAILYELTSRVAALEA